MISQAEGRNGKPNRGVTPTEQAFTAVLGRFVRQNVLQIGIICVFLLMWLLFIVLAPKTFLAPQIYGAYMSTIPFFGIMALPLTMVIIAGEIDLSFPSIMAVGTLAFLQVFTVTGSVGLAFVVCLVVGFLVGLLNGIIVVKIGIPSLIATIGTMFFWRGAVLVIGDLLGSSTGGGGSLVGAKGTLLRELLVGRIFNYVPAQMIWMILVGVAVWFILNRHKLGAHVYLIGDNEDSARLMGVNVDRTRMLVFAIVGVAASMGGILASLEVSYFWPTLGEGAGYLTRTLAAVFLGGTSVFGGRGTVLGTFVGCFIIGAIEAGIVAIGLTGFWTQLIYGLIIIVSVAMHTVLRKRIV